MSRILFAAAALAVSLCLACPAFAMIRVSRVTKTSQEGLTFDLTATRVHESVRIELAVPREGELRHLSAIRAAVRDEEGKQIFYVPLATTEENGTTKAWFDIAPDEARRCDVVLVLDDPEASPRSRISHVEIDVASYLAPTIESPAKAPAEKMP